ncbi:hypothetical protein [Nocardia pseudobrasiliensis]|uniref:Alpha-glucoside transport system permease protein n=1 Tax=Nocardia pseudobrasiliensis TaxID=45979 RepID=A0A370HZB3_9NOCA|nr:hypothetical protein [Nocardia pseudobrasiliensis]RDI63660.1 alpha-glucoside transport system permease protein [Nocardia pseudobrasiliensis]
MSSWHTEADGLILELAPRRPAGPLVRGWYLGRLIAAALQVPAAVLLTLMLVAPATATIVTAAETRTGAVILLSCVIVVVAGGVIDRLRRAAWTMTRRTRGLSVTLLLLAATAALLVRPPAPGSWSPAVAWTAAGVLVVAAGVSARWAWVMGGRWLLPVSAVLLVAPVELLFAARQRPKAMVSGAVLLCGAVVLAWAWRQISPSRSELPLAAVPAMGAAVAGIGVVAVALDDAGRQAYAVTVGWVVIALGVVLPVAIWAARGVGRRRWWPWWPLVLPFGISAFVAGLAFRLIFEPPVDAAGGVRGQLVLYALMLGAAFVWTWFGALFVLLRAAVDGIEADPVRSAYLHECTGARMWLRLTRLLNPIVLTLGLVVAVAAARVFDVILIAVPGPQQYVLDSATVHWWQLTTDRGVGQVAAEAYSLPLAVVVGLGAWLLQSGTPWHRSGWPRPDPQPIPVRWQLHRSGWASRRVGLDRAERVGAATQRWLGRVVSAAVARRVGGFARWIVARALAPVALAGRAGGLWLRVGTVSLLMLAPLIVLAAVSWLGPDGAAFTGPQSVWQDAELWHALVQTGWVAGFSTLMTVTAALPPAYYAATLDPQGWRSRVIVMVLVVLAVMPAQMYVGRIRAFVDENSLAGTSFPLILTHAALGLPIAILILRGALLAPPDTPSAGPGRGVLDTSLVLRRVWASAGPALVAVAVLQLVQVWNDFFVGQLVSGADASPWSLLLWSEARQFHENVAHLAAGALLSAVPPTVLLLATWRRFLVPGLTGGVLR